MYELIEEPSLESVAAKCTTRYPSGADYGCVGVLLYSLVCHRSVSGRIFRPTGKIAQHVSSNNAISRMEDSAMYVIDDKHANKIANPKEIWGAVVIS